MCWEQNRRRAKKQHACTRCGGVIPVGARYEEWTHKPWAGSCSGSGTRCARNGVEYEIEWDCDEVPGTMRVERHCEACAHALAMG